jgi:hypothetical protein
MSEISGIIKNVFVSYWITFNQSEDSLIQTQYLATLFVNPNTVSARALIGPDIFWLIPKANLLDKGQADTCSKTEW